MTAERSPAARLTLALTVSAALHGALLASFTSPRLRPGGSRPAAALQVTLMSPVAGQSLPVPAVSAPQLALAAPAAPSTKPSQPAKQAAAELESGDIDRPPEPLLDISPAYPEGAFAAGLSGKVEVEVWVDERGRVENAVVISTTMADAFNRSALKAVHEMRFTPGMRGGMPVKSSIRAVIVYDLK